MQSLIKWSGRKSKEFPYIKDLMPEFERYVEPFFGGGAIFFHLQPKEPLIKSFPTSIGYTTQQYSQSQRKP